MATAPANKPSLAPSVEDIEAQFHRLVAQWRADTLVLSDPSKIMGHPAMREIIALGEDVVPFILRDLREKPSLLVWALSEISGENLAQPSLNLCVHVPFDEATF